MSSYGVFLNSSSLGGAERSMILQCKNLSEHNVIFYIPYTENDSQTHKLIEYIKATINKPNVITYNYSASLYSLSRGSSQSLISSALKAFFGILKLMVVFKKLNVIENEVIWINGNKVGLVLLIFLKVVNFNKKVVYHLRDYPTTKFPFSILWKILKIKSKFKKIIISNSYDVQEKAISVIGHNAADYLVCYNPVELNLDYPIKNSVKVLGVASMLVEWKGIHFVINFMNIYKERLRVLGIEQLLIFGENIYHTNSSKSTYILELKKICKNNSSVKFMGNCKPEDIFSKIDILIHPSLVAEPFGRIIVEAFRSKIPVVSTCLGGAGELLQDNFNGYKCIANDYIGLFKIIEKLTNNTNRMRIIQNAQESDEKIKNQQIEFWKSFNLIA